jgi:hypothetical protein
MKRRLLLLANLGAFVLTGAQRGDDSVRNHIISVHTVERGVMPIFAAATGKLISRQPARALLTFDKSDGKCEAGRPARLVVGENPRVVPGKVIGATAAGDCEVEFLEALAEETVIGVKVRALIVSRELKDVVFFARPADSRPNSTARIFVVEDASHARRVTVRYGEVSGPLIQVLDGLTPGDKVIVTDMSKWVHLPSVRLE